MRTHSSEDRPEVRREKTVDEQKVRAPAPKEDVDQFRQLLERRQESLAQQSEFRDPAILERKQESETFRSDFVPAEAAALLHTQRLVFDLPASSPTVASPAPPAAGLADLIEKHVRQLLVSESARSGGADARILLRLADSVLPGTDLTLTRGANGWELRADVMTASARDALERCAPDLAKRFGESGLGEIQLQTVLHDDA
jgi:hypothetical protein